MDREDSSLHVVAARIFFSHRSYHVSLCVYVYLYTLYTNAVDLV